MNGLNRKLLPSIFLHVMFMFTAQQKRGIRHAGCTLMQVRKNKPVSQTARDNQREKNGKDCYIRW